MVCRTLSPLTMFCSRFTQMPHNSPPLSLLSLCTYIIEPYLYATVGIKKEKCKHIFICKII